MRITLKELCEKMGVDHALSPYETAPWVYYDDEKATTCSAEVRMGPSGDDLEAEIQFLKDESDDGEGDASSSGGGPEQIMLMRAHPVIENQWTPHYLTVKDKTYVNEVHDWEGKGCEFFAAVVQAINIGELPDIDELIEKHLSDDSLWGGGRKGKVGRKSPKIKPENLLGMGKRGM